MLKLTSAKIFFCIAVFLFLAKPFLGFSLFNRLHPPTVESIFIKAFTKRKVEEPENSQLSQSAIKKKLASAAQQFVFLFSFYLGTIFPVVYLTVGFIDSNVLRRLKVIAASSLPFWLLNGKLII